MTALAWTLLHSLWQAAVIAGALALALRVIDGRRAALRHALAAAALGAVALASLLTFWTYASPAAEGPRSALLRVAPAIASARSGALVELAPGLARAAPWLCGAWLTAVVIAAARTCGGLWLVARLGRTRSPTSCASADALARRLGLRGAVELGVSGAVAVPTLVGVIRPALLLPVGFFERLTPARAEAVIAHELAHVARRDPLANLAQVLVELLFVHHPAVRWISRQLRLERECCCDALAVELSGDALEYARALTDLASDLRPVVGRPTLVLNATGGTLMTRIHRLMSPSTDARATARGLPIALLALGVGVGLITPACDEAEPEPRAQVVEADGERTVRFKGEDGELVELKLQPGQKAMHFHKQEGGQIVLVDDGGEGPHGAHAATFIDDKGEVHQLEAGQFHFKGEAEGGALKLELKQGEGGAWVDDQGEEHALDGHEVKFIAAEDGEDAP
ncbi:MAG: M56 family metallopeptidase [Nannocystaceae bacterium]